MKHELIYIALNEVSQSKYCISPANNLSLNENLNIFKFLICNISLEFLTFVAIVKLKMTRAIE